MNNVKLEITGSQLKTLARLMKEGYKGLKGDNKYKADILYQILKLQLDSQRVDLNEIMNNL